MRDESLFLLLVLLGWFVPITFQSVQVLRPTIRSRLVACRKVFSQFGEYDDFSWIPKKRKREQAEMMLDQTYKDLQRHHVKTLESVHNAANEEKRLEELLRIAKDILIEQNTPLSSKQGTELHELQNMLKYKRKESEILRQRVTDLECEIQKAYSKKQMIAAQSTARLATLSARYMVEKTDVRRVNSMIEELRKRVVENESQPVANTQQILKHLSIADIDKLDYIALHSLLKVLRDAVDEMSLLLKDVEDSEEKSEILNTVADFVAVQQRLEERIRLFRPNSTQDVHDAS